MGYIVAIDGTSGSGKSSLAQALAKALHGNPIHSGWYYRALGLASLRMGEGFSEALLQLDIRYEDSQIFCDGENVTSELESSEAIDQATSILAQNSRVRSHVTQLLHTTVTRDAHRVYVIEGRDIGTVVFPSARYKFFVQADSHMRALRRLSQRQSASDHALPPEMYDALQDLLRKSQDPFQDIEAQITERLPKSNSTYDPDHIRKAVTQLQKQFQEIEAQLKARDQRDSTRTTAPLLKAEGAVVLDTSTSTVETSLVRMLEHIRPADRA